MKAIRLGNDIEFVWTVEGLTNVLGTKLVQLFNVNKGIPETMTYEISGDNISGLYKGKDQKEKGSYRLILYVNRGENDMVTLDCVNAFELVGVSNFGIVNGSDESAITIATINLRSTLDAAPVIPSIQAQADWEQSDSTKVDYIKNKPTLFSGDYEDLTNKPTIPDAQIQSDWNQSDSTKKDYIKNKPNVPSSLAELSSDSTHRVVTDSEKETWNNKSDFSGSYTDLTNKPSIPVVPTKVSAFINDVGYVNKLKTINGESLKGEGDIEIEQVQSDWNQSDSSKKDFIKNKPTIPVVPTKVSSFQNDAGYINDVSDKQDKLVSGTNIKTINNQSLLGSGNIDIQGGGGTQVQSDWEETDTDDPAYIKNKPTIPSEVTESTVAGWGFTKNTGDYSKPIGGIPSTDLSSSVQTSLGKADTALQEQVKANWNETNTNSAAYIQNKPSHLVSTDSYDGTGIVVPSDAQRLSSMMGYYECNTSGSTAAKVVNASGYVLSNGGSIRIKMTNANTADNVTLNINSTGAKALYYNGVQASSTNTWEADEVLEVYYDGTQYQCASGGGGGKFATGEKVRETGITDEILPNNNALVTSGTVYEGVGKYKYSNVELLNVTGSYASGRSNLGVVDFEIGKKYYVHYELSAPQSNKVALIAYLNSTGTSNYQNIAVMQIGDTSMDVVYEPTVTNKYVAIYHAISGSVGVSVQITEVRESGLVNMNEFTPVAQDVSELKSDFNVYKNALGDVTKYDLGVNDADYIYRSAAGSSNPVDNPNGVRLRVIYELDASTAYHIVASCNYGKGLCCAVYQTIEQAVYAGTDYTDVLSATYVPSVEGDVNGRFITFSFCKSDSSVISNEDKAAILAAANISITYGTISSIEHLQEQINEINNGKEYATALETNEDELYDKVSQQIDDNTLVLLITTDAHITPMRPESLNHPSIFARMAEIIGTDANVSLGDTISETDGDGIYYNRQRLELYMKGTRQSYMPFLYGIGHHEMYGASGGVYGNFTKPKVIGFTEKYTRHIECVYDSNNKSNFYCDFVLQGIRCIFLDSTYISGHPVGFEQATIDWFEDVALVNVPSGYKVLLFSHAPSLNAATFAPSASSMKVANDTVIRGIINTFNDGGGNLIAHFCGHAHCDNVVKQDGMTYTIIQTACAAAIPNGGVAVNQRPTAGTPIYYEDRTVGTINEYCIDIACIHSDTGIINMLRFGVGADRTINP